MAQSINHAVITGNLTRDVELRTTNGGATVAELGVAVNDREKVAGEWVDRAHFLDVTVWGAAAEACAKYLTKGSPVAVSGRLRQERWETDQGEKRQRVKIVADRVQFLGKREDGGQARAQTPPSQAAPAAPSPDDDIPF